MKDNAASITAAGIAKTFVFKNGDPNYSKILDSNIFDISYNYLETAIGKKALLYKLFGKIKLFQNLYHLSEIILAPGISNHYLIRKSKIENLIYQFHEKMNGCQQLVILGAGADSLGYRIANAKENIKVFEIDHPATQNIKKKTIVNNYPPKNNLTFIPADLSKKSLKETLSNIENFSFSEKTIFVAEGLIMYLKLEDVKKLFNIMQEFPKEMVYFIFTYMELNSKGKPLYVEQASVLSYLLKLYGEEIFWGLKPKDLDNFIKELNFKPGPHFDRDLLKSEYKYLFNNNDFLLLKGENITYIQN